MLSPSGLPDTIEDGLGHRPVGPKAVNALIINLDHSVKAGKKIEGTERGEGRECLAKSILR